MKIQWLGHACFLITSDSGTRIITDPYSPAENLFYEPVNESADVVTISHDHFDHNNVSDVKGTPEVVKGTTEAKGIKFNAVPTFHDDESGSKRGRNNIFCFAVDNVRVCHLGDLGHDLSEEQVQAIGGVDVVLAPVGGHFTVDATTAAKVCARLNAKMIIPMHFRNERNSFPVAGVEEFTGGSQNVTETDGSEVEIDANKLPSVCQVTVLKPAR